MEKWNELYFDTEYLRVVVLVKVKDRIFSLLVLITFIIWNFSLYLMFGLMESMISISTITLFILCWFLTEQLNKDKIHKEWISKTEYGLNQTVDDSEEQQAILALMENKEGYQTFLELTPELIAVYSIEGEFLYGNTELLNFLGVNHKEELLGRSVFSFIDKNMKGIAKARINEAIDGKCLDFFEQKLYRLDGKVRYIESKSMKIKYGGKPALLAVGRDITERKQLELKLAESEKQYRNMVENSPEPILVHIKGTIVFLNQAGIKMFGGKALDDFIGKSIFEFIDKSEKEKLTKRISHIQQGEKVPLKEMKCYQLNGQTIYVETIAIKITYKGESAIQVLFRDTTKRKLAEEKIKKMVFYDNLTELPNRRYLNDYMDKALMESKQKNQQLGVMLLDLDRFKVINDTMGHHIGDLLLQQVSKSLLRSVGNNGVVIRNSGDEFIILLKNTTQKNIKEVAQNIKSTFSSPVIVGNRELYTTFSIGISMFPFDSQDKGELLNYADKAMYVAKEFGKNTYQFYHSSHELPKDMQLENDLRNALGRKEFFLAYQPQVDLTTGVIIGVEALIRWKHPKLGIVPPGKFIPLAEDIGIIDKIGEWVLKSACYQMKKWSEAGMPPLNVSVNISPIQFLRLDLYNIVKKIINETGINPEYLTLEVTEEMALNVKHTLKLMKELRALGVKISIDDFGTGYSSLNQIKMFPINTLKIDQSFIKESDDIKNKNIIKAIIDIAHNLELDVIAEGVETEKQFEFLQQNLCDKIQGYFVSKPLCHQQFEEKHDEINKWIKGLALKNTEQPNEKQVIQ